MTIALVSEWWDRYGKKDKKNKINEIITAVNNVSAKFDDNYLLVEGIKDSGGNIIFTFNGSGYISSLIKRIGTPPYDVLMADTTNYEWYLRITSDEKIEFDTYDKNEGKRIWALLSINPNAGGVIIKGLLNLSGNLKVGDTKIYKDSDTSEIGLYVKTWADNGPAVRLFGPSNSSYPSEVWVYCSGAEGKGKIAFTKYDTTNSVWRTIAVFYPSDVSSISLKLTGDLQINGNKILNSDGSTVIQFVGLTTKVVGDLQVGGNDILDSGGTKRITLGATTTVTCNFNPSSDDTYLLGDSTHRWKELHAVTVYSGDLHLESKDAHWVLKESPDGIYAINEKTGERFKVVLEKISN